ncbi:hypothetical protein KAR91_13165 [Candidatus Pacearchaeota archaeon]|nr:hypothetical protein [Candidatus Pacearchaeota archaeon]
MSQLSELILFYRKDPEAFIEDVLDLKPTAQQKQVIDSVMAGNKYISVKSGHGTGKSTIVAALILWFICCYKSQIPITAPSSAQFWDALWSRLGELYNRMSTVFQDNFILLSDRLYSKTDKTAHFCVGRTAKKENPEALQGFHHKNLMFIVDEASGVHEEIFDTIMGSLTEENNILILIGNPLRISGTFYDSFNKNNGDWHNLSFNSEESPLVTPRYINQMAKYGKDSNKYRIRVLGKFPKSEADTLIPFDLAEAAQMRTVEASGSVVWGLDVARFGSDSSIIMKRQGNKVLGYKRYSKMDLMELVGNVVQEYKQTPKKNRPEIIFVDTIGLGAGAYDRLNELELPVREVNVSTKSSNSKEFKNVRAECYDTMREYFAEKEPEIPDDPDLLAQLTTVKYKFASNGSMQIEEKAEYKKRNPTIGSPDIADALMLTFFGRKTIEFNILFV